MNKLIPFLILQQMGINPFLQFLQVTIPSSCKNKCLHQMTYGMRHLCFVSERTALVILQCCLIIICTYNSRDLCKPLLTSGKGSVETLPQWSGEEIPSMARFSQPSPSPRLVPAISPATSHLKCKPLSWRFDNDYNGCMINSWTFVFQGELLWPVFVRRRPSCVVRRASCVNFFT